MGRRVEKVVKTYNGSIYANPVTTRFDYDGGILVAELDGDNANAVKCSYTSSKVIGALTPFPKCWSCYEERRYAFAVALNGQNHQVVICESHSKSGSDKEIVFDYWGNNFGSDPAKFRQRFPYLIDQWGYPYVTDCGGRPLVPPTRPPPSPQWDNWPP